MAFATTDSPHTLGGVCTNVKSGYNSCTSRPKVMLCCSQLCTTYNTIAACSLIISRNISNQGEKVATLSEWLDEHHNLHVPKTVKLALPESCELAGFASTRGGRKKIRCDNVDKRQH